MVKLKKVVIVDTRAADRNYCHWMRDHLTRFFWLKKLDIDFSEYVLITTNGIAGYYESSIGVLKNSGFNFKDWLSNKDFPHLYAEEMIIAPYTNFRLRNGFAFDTAETVFLRDLFLKRDYSDNINHDKIYLSRRGEIRSSEQEIELIKKLSEYNIKEVFLAEMTIFEQALLFSNASLIIGLHGAAFTNLVFCKPGVDVIEIFGADYIVSAYWNVADKLGLNYYAYCDDEYKNQNLYEFDRLAPTLINLDNFFTYLTKLEVL